MTTLNINTKSQLAKLIATENITVEHNNVRTASFDTLNRILTLPIFKEKSGDVYDMLIAHECAHALYTPQAGWKEIQNDEELRSYCNVLEDTRIDKLIQKKYPGVVRNYLNGWDILNKQNFFGIKDKDLNTELMLIDKINLRSKSLNRLKLDYSKEENKWLDVIDSIKSWKDVVRIAKELLNWQKKQIEKLKKLPNFDELSLIKSYNKGNKGDQKPKEKSEGQEAQGSSSGNDNKNEDKEDKNSTTAVVGQNEVKGGAGKLKAITDIIFEENKSALLDKSTYYNYLSLPKVDTKNIIISHKEFRKTFKDYIIKRVNISMAEKEYYNWLKDDFKKFKNDNKKTVMYLVKEFEMKKAATAYKRSTTDKTGVIDSLKLKNYKFSDDIFKRLTILPDSKNHGMIMLLDWSGSMADVIKQTVEQLLNLVYFCQKINIPYEVYFFSNERYERDFNLNNTIKQYTYKHGDVALDSFNLVNIASHKMKKTELDESMMYLYSMGLYYNHRYTSYSSKANDYSGYNFAMPEQYNLGSTPLNEALIACNNLIPTFKNKYKVEKMTFITLTDGGANSVKGQYVNSHEGLTLNHIEKGKLVVKHNKKYYSQAIQEHNNYWSSTDLTSNLLDIMRKRHGVNTIGFYIIKRLNRYEHKFFSTNDKTSEKRRKQFTKDKVTTAIMPGYDQYFLLNGKNMNVENNTELEKITGDLKVGKIKQLFAKSMKGRITSRVLLNKFIAQVA
jgi:hypothetical protein